MSRPVPAKPSSKKTDKLKQFWKYYEKFDEAQEKGDIVNSIIYASSSIANLDGFDSDIFGQEVEILIGECDRYLSTVQIDDVAKAQFARSSMNLDKIVTLMRAMTNPALAPHSYERVTNFSSQIIGKVVEFSRDKLSLRDAMFLENLICGEDSICGALNETESQRKIREISDLKSHVIKMEISQALKKEGVDPTKIGEPTIAVNLGEEGFCAAIYVRPSVDGVARKSFAKGSTLLGVKTAENDFMGEIFKMMDLADKGIGYHADESKGDKFFFAINLEKMRSSLRERVESYTPPAFVPLGVSPICDEGKSVADDGATRPPVDSASTKPARFSVAPSPITTPYVGQGGSSSAAAFHKPIAGRGGSSGGAKQ